MAIVDAYLGAILQLLRTKNSAELQFYLRVEPDPRAPDNYLQLSQELKTLYHKSDVLERQIAKLLPERDDDNTDEGDVWPGFLAFIQEYLEYWRDVDFDDLLETHTQLSGLANACVAALSNSQHGILVLPTTIQICSSLAKLTMTLDKRPDLTRQLRRVASFDQSENRKTLVEGTAESIQRAFTVCLTERGPNRSGIGKDGKPEGKKVGIYLFANLVLKLLFQCRKTQLAVQLFTNISQHSPPLALYPASQRVTYLYYLGRFHFSNTHFYRAQLCLESAYRQCHTKCTNQRRLILIYLVSANIIIGRFPSSTLLSRPEASGVLDRFTPIARAIQKGDLIAFKRAVGPESGNDRWLFGKGVLLLILHRCEVLVWRSLARRVFLLTYQFPTDANSRKAPTLDIADLVVAAKFCQKILEGWVRPANSMASMQPGKTHVDAVSTKAPRLVPPPKGRKKLFAEEGVLFGNQVPDIIAIEAIVASLVQQGLLHGFISHSQGKFAILGSKQKGGPLNAGFPSVWGVISDRAERDGKNLEVPGWVQRELQGGMGGVVNLSGIARPVGSGD